MNFITCTLFEQLKLELWHVTYVHICSLMFFILSFICAVPLEILTNWKRNA